MAWEDTPLFFGTTKKRALGRVMIDAVGGGAGIKTKVMWVAGEKYTLRTHNGFPRIHAEGSADVPEAMPGYWLSSSSGYFATSTIVRSLGYDKRFSTFSTLTHTVGNRYGSGVSAGPGSLLRADGNGGCRALANESKGDVYGISGPYGDMEIVDPFGAEAGIYVSSDGGETFSRAFGVNVTNHNGDNGPWDTDVNISGEHVVCGVELADHTDGGFTRTHPVFWIYRKVSGTWVKEVRPFPFIPTDDSYRTVPAICHHGAGRISAVWSRHWSMPLKVAYSDNFGATWSTETDVNDIFNGAIYAPVVAPSVGSSGSAIINDFSTSFSATDSGYLDMLTYVRDGRYYDELVSHGKAGQTPSAISTEAAGLVHAKWGVPAADHIRARNYPYLSSGLSERERDHFSLRAFPVSKNKIVVYTSVPYEHYSGKTHSVTLIDIRSGVVRRSQWLATNDSKMLCVPLGQGSWIVRFKDAASGVLVCKTTGDFGETYTSLTGEQPEFEIGVIRPVGHESGFLAYGIFDELGSTNTDVTRNLATTTDFVEYSGPNTIGNPSYNSGPAYQSYDRVIYIGTEESPGPVFPAAPWACDDRVETPTWWNDD